jgi:hypothetical protein
MNYCINQIPYNSRFVCWGVGPISDALIRFLDKARPDLKLVKVVDRRKIGGYQNFRIDLPENLRPDQSDWDVIFLCTSVNKDLEEQLMNCGFPRSRFCSFSIDSAPVGVRIVYDLILERDAYVRSYHQVLCDNGRLDRMVVSYRSMYEGLGGEEAHGFRFGNESRGCINYDFLVLSNGRTGSTWLSTSLGQVDGVSVKGELNWWIPGQLSRLAHIYVNGPCREFTSGASLGDRPNDARRIGSKFVFQPYYFYGDFVFRSIRRMISPETKLVFLKRNYLATWISWKVRGVHHVLNPKKIEIIKISDPQLFESVASLDKPINRKIQFTVKGVALPVSDECDRVFYPLEEAIDDLLVLFYNDCAAYRHLSRRFSSHRIQYETIPQQFSSLLRFLDLNSGEEEIQKIFDVPITLKLDRLNDCVDSLDLIGGVAEILDRAYENYCCSEDEQKCPIEWLDNRELRLHIPELSKWLRNCMLLDSDCGSSCVWRPFRPVITF